jgi:hypothetical protein
MSGLSRIRTGQVERITDLLPDQALSLGQDFGHEMQRSAQSNMQHQ